MNLQPCIVITGAAGGIGGAVVQNLLEHPDFQDHQLIALDRNWTDTKQSHLASDRILTMTADVSQAEEIDLLFEELAQSYTVQGLVNAAGALHYGNALECTPETLDQLLNVNAKGVFNVCNAAARLMLTQHKSSPVSTHKNSAQKNQYSIVTVASNAATGPRALFSAYGASKAFASHYTRSLGLELGRYGIRCNVVCPGTTRTAMLAPIWQGKDLTEATISGSPENFRNGIPLQKIAEPAEIASTIVFLLSNAASHLTLAELTVDGGATQR
ncbi:SDR family oxidoreductase [uncultured Rothia sp.]|uniref:SDR family oxidoreductase n=1 Tax=uncultured Rothia sp. TaxID=316088 RepID=UPI003217020D